MRHCRPHHVAARGVQHPFRRPGAAGGIQDEQRVLRPHLLGRAVRAGGGEQRRVVVVAPFLHRHAAPRHLHDDHMLHGRAVLERLVRVGLQRHLAPAPAPLVGGDQDSAAAVLDAVRQAVRGEAAEHHRMDRAEPGAGQHRHRRLHHHRHIDRHPVPALHAEAAQRVGQAAHLLVQLAVRDPALLVRVVAFPDDRHLVRTLRQVPVEAGGGCVQRAVLIPADADVALEAGVLRAGGRAHPGDAPRLLGPERLGVGDGGLRHGAVLLRRHVGMGRDLRQDGVGLVGHSALPRR